MKKNIAVYISDVMGKHFRISREFAWRSKKAGNNVYLIVCNGDLQVCPAKNNSDVPPCILCRSKRKRVLNQDFGCTVPIYSLDLSRYKKQLALPDFTSIEELKQYKLDGIDHGLAAASTVISRLRDPNPDIQRHKSLVCQSLFTSIATYQEMMRMIETLDIDILHIQNGRRASQRPALRAGQRKGITVYVGEDGHNSSRCYIAAVDTYPHDLAYIKKDIKEHCDDAESDNVILENANKFFHDRRFGSKKIIGEANYTEHQEDGKLPSGLNQHHHNVAIFNSSEDEFVAIEGYENPLYKNQIEALRRIIEDTKISDNTRFFLRVHPNLATRDNVQTRMIETLSDRRTTVIPARSDVDTYAVMEACDTVLTFGSTMGIESAYYGKPSVLVGRAPFEDLGSCYIPSNHDDVIKTLNNTNLPALDNFGACKFGHYMVSRDINYEFIDGENEHTRRNAENPSRIATLRFIAKHKGINSVFKAIRNKISGNY